MKRNHLIGIGIGALVLVLATAGASAFIANGGLDPEKPTTETTAKISSNTTKETITWNQPQPAPKQQAATNCDDGNVVGKVVGGVAGGVAGSQVGKGKGKTAATIGGTLGGAYLGGEFLPTDNVTCK